MDAVCALETTAQQSTAEHPQTTGQTLWKPEFALGENGPICAKCSLAGADTHSTLCLSPFVAHRKGLSAGSVLGNAGNHRSNSL